MATVRPDGRPHSAGVGAVWVDGALYFVSGPGTLKSRNLAVESGVQRVGPLAQYRPRAGR